MACKDIEFLGNALCGLGQYSGCAMCAQLQAQGTDLQRLGSINANSCQGIEDDLQSTLCPFFQKMDIDCDECAGYTTGGVTTLVVSGATMYATIFTAWFLE